MAYTDQPDYVARDPLPAARLNEIRDNFRFLHDRGADIASATSITATSSFHKVTGTSTIDTINGATDGHELLLWLGSPLTIRNNGGSVGNVRTYSGVDTMFPANALVLFRSDGTVWQEVRGGPVNQYDRQTLTAPVTVGTGAHDEASATAVITGNSVNYDGAEALVEAWLPGGDVTGTGGRFLLLCDTTVIGQAVAGTRDGPFQIRAFHTPAAGSHTYALKAFTDGSNAITINAGAGLTGNLLPGFLRVTRA